jgi:Arc/MetJ-type ribon-helix-helix transcriptional regulator
MTTAPVAAEDRNLAPVSVALPPDQVSWLDDHARSNRISRSAVVRQAIDRLMRQQRRSLS